MHANDDNASCLVRASALGGSLRRFRTVRPIPSAVSCGVAALPVHAVPTWDPSSGAGVPRGGRGAHRRGATTGRWGGVFEGGATPPRGCIARRMQPVVSPGVLSLDWQPVEQRRMTTPPNFQLAIARKRPNSVGLAA